MLPWDVPSPGGSTGPGQRDAPQALGSHPGGGQTRPLRLPMGSVTTAGWLLSTPRYCLLLLLDRNEMALSFPHKGEGNESLRMKFWGKIITFKGCGWECAALHNSRESGKSSIMRGQVELRLHRPQPQLVCRTATHATAEDSWRSEGRRVLVQSTGSQRGAKMPFLAHSGSESPHSQPWPQPQLHGHILCSLL